MDIIGLAIIVIVLTLMLGAGALFFIMQSNKVQVDAETLCPIDGPTSITVILIDRTDELSVVQQAAVRSRLEDIKNDIPTYGALELYSVAPVVGELLRPEIKICNPGTGEDVSAIYGNPRKVEKRWRETFSSRLDSVLASLLIAETAKTSPIMESIQSISVTALYGERKAQIEKRLVIVSDMLQHTSDATHYSGLTDFREFRKTTGFQKLRTDLQGVEVVLMYLRRPTAKGIQGQRHIEFWQQYIAELNGSLVRVSPIDG